MNKMLVSDATQRFLSSDPARARAFLQGVHCISNHCGGALNPETCTLQAYLRFVAHEADVWHRTLASSGAHEYAAHSEALSTLLSALERANGGDDGLVQQCRAALASPLIVEHQEEQQPVMVSSRGEGQDVGAEEEEEEDVTTVPFSILDMKNAISAVGSRSSFYKLAKHHAMRHGHGDDWPLMDYFEYVAGDPEGWILHDRPASQSGESTIRRLIQMMRHALDFAARQFGSSGGSQSAKEQLGVIARCQAAIDGLPHVSAIATAAPALPATEQAGGTKRPSSHIDVHQDEDDAMATEEAPLPPPPAQQLQQQVRPSADPALGYLVSAMESNLAQIRGGDLAPAQAVLLCESMQYISKSLACIFQNDR